MMSCDLCHNGIKYNELNYIRCHRSCWLSCRYPPDIPIQDLEKKINYKRNCSGVELFCRGNERLSEDDKKNITDAFNFKDHSSIIDDIFHYCQEFVSIRTREMFCYMINEYIIERTKHKKAATGSFYTHDFFCCFGHFGEQTSPAEFTCSDCKEVITDEFRHCCCYQLKD